MADNPAGVVLSALATTAYTVKQPKKKGRQTNQDNHLKDRATTNKTKHMQSKGRVIAAEQNRERREQWSCNIWSLMLQLV